MASAGGVRHCRLLAETLGGGLCLCKSDEGSVVVFQLRMDVGGGGFQNLWVDTEKVTGRSCQQKMEDNLGGGLGCSFLAGSAGG